MRRLIIGMCTAGVLCAGGAWAQQTSINTGDNGVVTAAMVGAVENKPYQAEKSTRSLQKLADGTVISVETHGLVARASTGVLREDIHSNVSGMAEGRMLDRNTTMAMVADPAASSITMWQIGEDKSKLKTAMVMQLPSLGGMKRKGSMAGALGMAPPPLPSSSTTLGHFDPNNPPKVNGPFALKLDGKKDDNPDKVTHEDLGQQSIEGLLVTGKRTTTVIPLGKIGNDRPITVIDEVWTAPELGIVVKQIDSDPRIGERTMELTGITKTEPDAALFHPPADYKVQDMSQMMKSLGEMGKTKSGDEKK